MVLRERLGTIGGRALVSATIRFASSALVMAFVVALVAALIGSGTGIGGWVRLIRRGRSPAALVYIGSAGVAAIVSAWQTSRRRGAPRARAAQGGQLAPVRIVTDNGGDLPPSRRRAHTASSSSPSTSASATFRARRLRGVDGRVLGARAASRRPRRDLGTLTRRLRRRLSRRPATTAASGVVCVTISSRPVGHLPGGARRCRGSAGRIPGRASSTRSR